MKNKVVFGTLDGSAPTCSVDGTGVISLPAGSGERWAVLLPQDAVSEGDYGSAYTSDKHYYGTCGYVPTIESNDYNSKGIAVNVTDPSGTVMGMLPGEFSVSDTKKVHFSKGNLQYRASSSTWRFAEAQYSYVGDATDGNVYDDNGVKCNNANISASYSGWIDLFGWGTSGADTYYPYLTEGDVSYYPFPGERKHIQDTKYDWGVNEISNASSLKTWRTMTAGEYGYLLRTRTGEKAATVNGTSNVLYVIATINTDVDAVKGMIIFPDGATIAADAATSWGTLNSTNCGYDGTQLTQAQWIALESVGCVFIPACGYRSGTDILNVNKSAIVWTSTGNNSPEAFVIHSTGTWGNVWWCPANRSTGVGVRLVCE